MTAINAVLFDLDGTLLDTAQDLGFALNALLQEEQLPQIPFGLIRPIAGKGCRALLKLGMNIEPNDPRYPALCDKLLEFYPTLIRYYTAFPRHGTHFNVS